MNKAEKIKWCDGEIEKSLAAFDANNYSDLKLDKLSDSQAMDVIARASAYGSNPKNKNIEDLARHVSTLFLVTISRTGRARKDFDE